MLCGITYCVPVLFTSSQTTLSPAAELQSRADRPGTVSTRRCFFCLTTVLTFTYKSVSSETQSSSKHYSTHEPQQPLLWWRLSGAQSLCSEEENTFIWFNFMSLSNWFYKWWKLKGRFVAVKLPAVTFTQWSAEPRCESKLPFYSSQLWMWTTSRREDVIRLSSDWNKHLCEHQLICCDGDRTFTPHNSPGDGRIWAFITDRTVMITWWWISIIGIMIHV